MGKEIPATKISIRDAVLKLESARNSIVISYIALQNALITSDDAPVFVDSIEQMNPSGSKIKKLDLFLHSSGGFLDSAYKIVRIFKEYSEEFNVIVPHVAKSAATVICLGAHEIVMTSYAELGPIDPIIQHPYKPEVKVPARSIRDFFDFLNQTETEITVDDQIKKKMAGLLDPYLIGSYQSALKSSKQIAEMLLKETPLKNNPDKLKNAVDQLTERYHSHGFAIDRGIVRDLGLNVKKAEDDRPLIESIRLLFNIYQEFMRRNNIIKLIGNREANRHIQLPPQVPTKEGPPESTSIMFS